MNKKKTTVASTIVNHIGHATFCNEISPHQELVDKLKSFDLSKHTPTECLTFVYELKLLVESYG